MEARTIRLWALGLSMATSCALMMLPTYTDGKTLTSTNGIGIIPLLSLPVALAVISLAHPSANRITSVVLLLCVLLGGWTVGLFYLPTVVLLFVSGFFGEVAPPG